MCSCVAARQNETAQRMGRRARAKTRKKAQVGPSGPKWSTGNPAEMFDMLNTDPRAYIGLLRSDDTAAITLRSLLGTNNSEMPVALIEPLRDALVWHNESSYDLRLAIATKMGLPLVGSAGPLVAAGWSLSPRQGKWELADPTRTVIARCEVATGNVAAEPAWTAQAMTVGQILIAYGSRVGVRLPDGVPVGRYDDRYRAAELAKSLDYRQACVAIVKLSPHIAAFRRASVT